MTDVAQRSQLPAPAGPADPAARRSRRPAEIGAAIVGAVAIIGAGFNGASFLDVNQDYSSMIMAGLFALALGSYLLALYVTTTPTAICGHDRAPNEREINR